MEDKKQDVNSLEELVKTADSFREFFSNLANELAKILPDVEIPDEEEEETWEMKCPYKDGDEYYFVSANGLAKYDSWDNYDFREKSVCTRQHLQNSTRSRTRIQTQKLTYTIQSVQR